MVLQVSEYTDPGVLIGPVLVPGGANVATQPLTLGVIGPGSREKRVTNEAILRGLVEAGALTFSALSGTAVSGTDSISAPSAGLQTMSIAAAAFITRAIGSYVTVRGAPAAANNGVFLITDRPSATSIVYANAGGAADAAFAGTYAITPTAIIGGASPIRTNRAIENTTVYRNAKAISDSFVSFKKAHIETALAGPIAITNATALVKTACAAATTRGSLAGWTEAGTGATRTLTAPAVGTTYNDFDGVTLIATNRLLVKDAGGTATSLLNGIYSLTTAGTGGAAAVLTRVSDMDVDAELVQYLRVPITGGTVSAGLTYTLVQTGATIETTPISFVPANTAFALELDGNVPLTIVLGTNSGATRVNGAQVIVRESKVADLNAITIAELVAAINEALSPTDATALAAVTALGYGTAYATAAKVITSTGIRIQSPLTTPASDVRVSAPYASSGLVLLFGAAGILNRDAPSVLELQRVAYSSTATYTVDYVNTLSTEDPTLKTGILSIARIGTAPGIGTFTENTDFALAGDSAHVDWSIGAAAAFTTSVADLTPDLSTNQTVRFSVDGNTAIDINLAINASAPLGWVKPLNTAAATQDEIAVNINATLAASASYGARYQAVASVVGGYLTVTSPEVNSSSALVFSTPVAADDAMSAVFGLAAAALPATYLGTGRHPAVAATYFVTYDITRPAADYNIQKRFITETAAIADLGVANANNPLAIAVKLAFRQKVSSIVVVQVDDATDTGSPIRAEFADAFEATTNSDLITEMVVLSTDLAVQIDLKDHIESESSPTKKHYRRGYFGMAIDTDPGDLDTPDTFVYRAARTLQVDPESPGRGRMTLVAPPQREGNSIDLTQLDGTVERVQLDGCYNAVVAAAKVASFTNPALSLARQTVGGFNVDDIDLSSIWKPEERKRMASKGVLVTTYDAGNFKFLDPVTTEAGNGGLAEFSYVSTSTQKDNVTRKVDAALDANIVGIVPTDLSDFIIDIKTFIADVLTGEIGVPTIAPYRSGGQTRRINLATDIEVEQDANDPTKFYFGYYFNLRYPALRLLGQFSVDNPFFS